MVKFKEEKNYESVKVTGKAWSKMCNYLRLSEGEIGGLIIVNDSDGILVEDIFLPKQVVSGGSVKLDMASAMTELVNEKPELLAKVKGWWHTHPSFGCFWSGVDNDTSNRLLGNMPYVVSMVQSEQYVEGLIKGVPRTNWEKQMWLLTKISMSKPHIEMNGIDFDIIGNRPNTLARDTKHVAERVTYIKPPRVKVVYNDKQMEVNYEKQNDDELLEEYLRG